MTLPIDDASQPGLAWTFAGLVSVALHIALVALLASIAPLASADRSQTQISISMMQGPALAAVSAPAAPTAEAVAPASPVLRAEPRGAARLGAADTAVKVANAGSPERARAVETGEVAPPAATSERAAPSEPDKARPIREAATAEAADQVSVPASVADSAANAEAARDAQVAAAAPEPLAIEPAGEAEIAARAAQAPASAAAPSQAVAVAPKPMAAPERAPVAPASNAAATTASPGTEAAPALPAAIAARPAPEARKAAPSIRAAPGLPAVASPVEATVPAPAQRITPAERAPPDRTPVLAAPPLAAPAPARIVPAEPAGGARIASLPPARTSPRPAESPGARLERFLKTRRGGTCFLAVPARGASDTHLRVFSDNPADFASFGEQSSAEAGVYSEPAPVGSAQCGALAFARALPRYPDFGLRIELDTPDVSNGARLKGRILDADGSSIYLLLVDDEGVVQRIPDRYLKPVKPGERSFSLPLSLTNKPETPTQLLVGIAASRVIPELENFRKTPADTFFDRLRESVDATDLDFGIIAFVVR